MDVMTSASRTYPSLPNAAATTLQHVRSDVSASPPPLSRVFDNAILFKPLSMLSPATAIEIPNRALFKAAEVCELVKVQPYVLRSWEAEFPELGVARTAGGPRVYRRADVERVLRIKHLLLVEGLTLAGARRRLTEETAPVAADTPVIDELIGQNARERLTEVKRGLRSILELLTPSNHGTEEFQLAAPTVATPAGPRRIAPAPARHAKSSRSSTASTASRHTARPRR
jgi:DNA-binding transcriptional MerR regulator